MVQEGRHEGSPTGRPGAVPSGHAPEERRRTWLQRQRLLVWLRFDISVAPLTQPIHPQPQSCRISFPAGR